MAGPQWEAAHTVVSDLANKVYETKAVAAALSLALHAVDARASNEFDEHMVVRVVRDQLGYIAELLDTVAFDGRVAVAMVIRAEAASAAN